MRRLDTLDIARLTAVLVTLTGVALADDVPRNVVADVRIVEARSETPDYQTMTDLAFFVNTDGQGVSERQWLATIGRQVPESFLATLATETVSVEGSRAVFELEKRSRRLRLSWDFGDFLAKGVFPVAFRGELEGGRDERRFEKTLEMQLGQTYVWSGPDMELSPSEYLSHFRDYRDREHRGELYEVIREYDTFLVIALTLRSAGEPAPTPVTLSLDSKLPRIESPLGIGLVGEVELELELNDEGGAEQVRIVRSSIPEANPRLLGEALEWSFPEAKGRTGRLWLEVEASP